MTSREVLDVFDFLNKINATIESCEEKIDTNLPCTMFSGDEKALLRAGKDHLKRCADRFRTIKEQIERYIYTKLVLNADLLRVMSMKSELDSEVYECSICLVVISKVDKTWSCSSCYNVLHMECVRKYVMHELRAPIGHPDARIGSWKCPVCRQQKDLPTDNPFVYTCFCGAVKNPLHSEKVSAHSCGRRCQRSPYCRMDCHPAACPVGQ